MQNENRFYQEVLDIALRNQSLQSRAMQKALPSFKIIGEAGNEKLPLIVTPADIEFSVFGSGFRISTHTLILGTHYLVGPMINYIEVGHETDWGDLVGQLRHFDLVMPLRWANWLCLSMGINRVVKQNQVSAKIPVDQRVEYLLEIVSGITKMKSILRTQGEFPSLYADELATNLDYLTETKTKTEKLKFMGYTPFYDLNELGRVAFEYAKKGQRLGTELDLPSWQQLKIFSPESN